MIPYLKEVSCVEMAYVHHRKHRRSTTSVITSDRMMHILPMIDNIRNWYQTQGWDDEYGELCEYFCIKSLLCGSVERISYLQSFAERRIVIKKTTEYIRLYYPDYRENPELGHGMRGLYMKTANTAVVILVEESARLKNKWKQMTGKNLF